MKASRILAGMSAAAFAASLMSMVSVSAATEIAPADFGAQVYVMGSTNWNWKSVDSSFADDGSITVTANAEDIWAQSSEGGDTLIGGAGVQFYLGDAVKDLAETEYTTETIEYTITASGDESFKKEGTVEATLGKKGDDGKRVTTTEVEIAGYESDPAAFTALGDITVTATIKDITVAEEEAVDEYTFPWTDDFGTTYGGDWGSDAYVSNKVYELAPADKNVKITIDYTLESGYDYYLAALATANGWGKVYDEKAQQKYDEAVADGDEELAENLKQNVWKASSIKGVDLKSSLTDEELEARAEAKGAPVLQDDGFFIFYDSGSFSFEISPEAVNWFATYLGGDTGDYGGSLFQVYGVNINKITIEEGSEEEEPSEGFTAWEMWSDLNWNPASNWNSVENGGHGKDANITKDGTYTVSFGPAYYAEDGETVVYDEAPEGTDAIKWEGAGVWNVDIEGLADAIGASTAGIDDLTAADKKQLAVDAGLEISNVKVLVDGEDFYQIPDEKLLYGDIEGNGKIRIEIMNQYGNGTYDPSSEFYVEDFFNKAGELSGSEVTVTFDITGVPEDVPTPEPGEHSYELLTEDGNTEETVELKVGDGYDFTVFLTDDGEPVEGEDIVWAEVDQKDEAEATSFKALGDVDATAVPTDENGASTITLYANNVGTGVVSASYTDEDGEKYEVLFTVNISAADPSSDESSSSSSNGGNSSNGGGNSSGAAEGDNNPATGAAALGTVGILLAGAAMAVSKKKH